MNITLEQVEKIREKTGLSYEEAKAALMANDGDMLETLIYLERQGRAPTAEGNGFYSTKSGADQEDAVELALFPKAKGKKEKDTWGKTWVWSFDDIWQAFRDLLNRSVTNHFEVWRADRMMTSMPVIIFLLLAVLFYWCTLPLLVVGLFFGFRYRFRGPDLGREAVNEVMEGISNAVDDVKENLKKEFKDKK